ncbi:MAG: hypothetical protein FJZ56_02300 [Chlamydiae bacterium]|nr:hypothetical protein [Chlamydiota bacterium]
MKKYTLDELKEAFLELKYRYREEREEFMTEDVHRAAYLHYRAPATLKVLEQVLSEVKKRVVDLPITVMDVGAGPGLSKDVFKKVLPSVEKITFLEKDRGFGSDGDWIYEDVRDHKFEKQFDLFLFSYMLNELPIEECYQILSKVFSKTKSALIIVEPGSKEGFQRVLNYRKHLIDLGGFIAAPCPHEKNCPLESSWCHFSVRVQRSLMHRQIKEGSLNYEDEKFCYLVVTKNEPQRPHGRIVDKVDAKARMVTIPLCSNEGFNKKIFTKRKCDQFSELKKTRWGDAIEQL